MRPCDNVIVTIQIGNYSCDMELPAFLPMQELVEKVDESIHVMRPGLLGGEHIACFVFNGKSINPDSSLAQSGVWDGSTLNCQMQKEVSA